ncbi:uncharacterized protein I206_103548 [Kwoniella pini CBS 10737]|uniref:Uncharacterized protein n=1 Tax=Kwoniella pini CBS 10737 TaxID=1296096 RepID=A0A1B9I9K3_9TREE|nr:uncharacterized protein I206_01448 [Kwoniella pini CBS 10737]OCF52163.1 hypothetical protein I206_01448 [Kwoniella pini CBS 10737]
MSGERSNTSSSAGNTSNIPATSGPGGTVDPRSGSTNPTGTLSGGGEYQFHENDPSYVPRDPSGSVQSAVNAAAAGLQASIKRGNERGNNS